MPTEDFAQLQLQFVDHTQWRYEVIRPVVLFADRTPQQRSQETQTHPATVRTILAGAIAPTEATWVALRRTADQRASPAPVSRHQGGPMPTAYRTLLERSQNGLRRIVRKPAWDFNRFVADPRPQKGRRWKFPTRMRALWCGFLTNRGRLRAGESLTECSFDQRIPDSTLYDLLGKFSGDEVAALRRQLHAPVRTDWRSQAMEPVGLPCGVDQASASRCWDGCV